MSKKVKSDISELSLGRNIEISVKRHAIISVIPVFKRPWISSLKALFFFSASIIPSWDDELLKMDIAAKTKPNNIPEMVDTTPAIDTMALWSIVIVKFLLEITKSATTIDLIKKIFVWLILLLIPRTRF
nr:hypothetical protein [Providencia rettgeri]